MEEHKNRPRQYGKSWEINLVDMEKHRNLKKDRFKKFDIIIFLTAVRVHGELLVLHKGITRI